MRKLALLGMLVACLFTVFAVAADQATPPKYIWTQHVTLAGDKVMAYSNLIAQFRQAADVSKADVTWIAAGNLTGNMRQVNFICFHENLASVEKDVMAWEKIAAAASEKNPNILVETGAAELQPTSTIAKYVEELSYQPDKVAPPETKWWQVETIYIKPGHDSAFRDLVKEEKELLKSANVDEHFLVYRLMHGLPGPGAAYYVVVPMKSLAEMDVDRSEQYKSVFTPMVKQHFQSVIQKIVAHSDSNLLMVQPNLSRPPQTFVAANPEFWTVKEPQTVASKTKKGKKTATEMGE